MAENETVTDSGSKPSAVAWVNKLLPSGLLPPTSAGEPATRSLNGSASTGLKSTDLAVEPFRIGPYEVLEKVGEGGMGFVFRVRNTELKRVEALKLIAPRNSDDSTSRARFEREFLAQAKIEHRHIVPVYAAGTWDGKPYFTMKYVPGGALSKHLDRFRADPEATAALMAKVARAVQRLHADKILHRDLKPHNILLDDGDEPLVADFGLVKNLDENSDASMTGAPMGTRQYMSPEQTFAHRADYTPACDVWAIGVILYELFAGVRPFPSSDPVEVYLQIRQANPTPVLEANPAAPPALAAITHRCLAKAPTDRYPTAAAVADDLEAWLAGDAVTATLPLPEPKPRPRWHGWAAAVALVAVACGLGAWWAARPPSPGLVPTPEPDGPPVVASSGLPVAPPPRDALTVGEKLALGRTVEFVGEKGGFLLPTRLAPGTTTTTTLTPDGYLSLASAGLAAVELSRDPLPAGTQLVAEVADYLLIDGLSLVGVYGGGQSWGGPDGNEYSVVVALAASSGKDRRPDGSVVDVNRFGFALVPLRGRAVLALTQYPERSEPATGLSGPDRPLQWQTVTLTPGPNLLIGDWSGRPIPPAGGSQLPLFLRGHAPPPPKPAHGDGIGLVVHRAGAVFRNVRLVPPPLPVPREDRP